MSYESHLERAERLMDVSRYELAEKELRHALTQDPNGASAHALLAYCLTHRDLHEEANIEAKIAVHLSPDIAAMHFIRAHVLMGYNHVDDASDSVTEALRLDPNNAEMLGFLAYCHFRQNRLDDATNAVEAGLAIDPENIVCHRVRAIVLTVQGLPNKAWRGASSALAFAPDDAILHLTLGWNSQARGEQPAALAHFREVLRKDPHLASARTGLVEALRSQNPIYRWLRFFQKQLISESLHDHAIGPMIIFCAFIIGGLLIFKAVDWYRGVTRVEASLILAGTGLLIAFGTLTPAFNFFLRWDRLDRFTLSRDEISASNWLALLLLFFFVGLSAWIRTGNAFWFFLAFHAELIYPVMARIYICEKGWPRNVMWTLATGLASLVVYNLVAIWRYPLELTAGIQTFALLSFGVFLLSFMFARFHSSSS